MTLITKKVSGPSVPRMTVTVQTEFIKCSVTCVDDSGLEADSELGKVAELFALAIAGVGFLPEQIDTVMLKGVK